MMGTITVSVLAAALALSAPAQTLDEIVAKSISAQGGQEKLKAVQSQRLVGRISFGPDAEGPFMVELKRPEKMHIEIKIQGMTLIRTFDGKSGWQVNPFDGKTDPQPMTPDDIRNVSEEADFDGPLVEYKEKGNQIELVGKEDVRGKSAYKLKVMLKNGDLHYYYFGSESYLKVKWEGQRMMNGRPITVESFFSDYREVNGLMFPYRIESHTKGSPQKQEMTFASIELNPQLDDARFAMPAAKLPATH